MPRKFQVRHQYLVVKVLDEQGCNSVGFALSSRSVMIEIGSSWIFALC
jgi:hypothetical protein